MISLRRVAFVRIFLKEGDQVFPKSIIFRILEKTSAIARPRKLDVQNVANFGCGSIGHHDDPI